MATGDQTNMSDLEKGGVLGMDEGQEDETVFNGNDVSDHDAVPQEQKQSLLPESDSTKENGNKKSAADDFYGLSREELEQYASDPKWVKIRWILFGIFVAGWVAMLVAAIVIVVLEPKCPRPPNREWYQSDVAYKLDTSKFKDSDGDGIGDLNGITSKSDHFEDLGVGAIWLTNFVKAGSALDKPSEDIGTFDDFNKLTAALKKKAVRTIIDLSVGDSLQLNKSDDSQKLEGAIRTWAKAGAGGFVIQLTDSQKNAYSTLLPKLQMILDEEFNKLDDRQRLVIPMGAGVQSLPADSVRAAVVTPTVNCSDASLECNMQRLRSLIKTASSSVWPIAQIQDDLLVGSSKCQLALKLTIKGTPNVMAGAEIGGLVNGYMKWDDSPGIGFSTNESFVKQISASISTSSIDTVRAQSSDGYPGMSHLKLFKDLTELIGNEPDLLYGDIKAFNFGSASSTLAFKREYSGGRDNDAIVVVLNVAEEANTGSIADGDRTEGEVLVADGPSLDVGDVIDATSVYLPSGSVLVVRIRVPEEDK